MFNIIKTIQIFLEFSAVLLFVISANIAQQAYAEVIHGIPRTIAHDFLELEKPFGAGIRHDEYINKLINKASSKNYC